jgi:hypothetical protein
MDRPVEKCPVLYVQESSAPKLNTGPSFPQRLAFIDTSVSPWNSRSQTGKFAEPGNIVNPVKMDKYLVLWFNTFPVTGLIAR